MTIKLASITVLTDGFTAIETQLRKNAECGLCTDIDELLCALRTTLHDCCGADYSMFALRDLWEVFMAGRGRPTND